MPDDFEKIFSDKNRVMVVFAHPDDAEVMAGGTIARLVSHGKRVRIVKITSGDRGSRTKHYDRERELSSKREVEDTNSMNLLGISPEDNIYIRVRDGEVQDSIEVIGKVAYQIREFQPDIIITHNPEHIIVRFDEKDSWVNHRDHRNTAQAVIDAAYPYSRDLLFFPEQFENKKLKSHNVTQFLLADYYGHPDEVFFDVTNFLDQKVDAISCHESQFTRTKAQEVSDFLTNINGERRERFRFVNTD